MNRDAFSYPPRGMNAEEASRYTRDADQAKMARDGMAKIIKFRRSER